jgi:hypothetical protein
MGTQTALAGFELTVVEFPIPPFDASTAADQWSPTYP